ncbi:hypothetical protein GCM10007421_01280 [Halopseudomonas oceani]|nr:hypothetical protein GCM10007421_01280 [Halopseudomonas oceani]
MHSTKRNNKLAGDKPAYLPDRKQGRKGNQAQLPQQRRDTLPGFCHQLWQLLTIIAAGVQRLTDVYRHLLA